MIGIDTQFEAQFKIEKKGNISIDLACNSTVLIKIRVLNETSRAKFISRNINQPLGICV